MRLHDDNIIWEKYILNLFKGNLPQGYQDNIYYHVTTINLYNKIKRDGYLKMDSDSLWASPSGEDIRQEDGIFVFENYYDSLLWANKTKNETNHGIVILKIKNKDRDFVVDRHWESNHSIGKWLIKKSPISIKEIIDVIPFDNSIWNKKIQNHIAELKSK